MGLCGHQAETMLFFAIPNMDWAKLHLQEMCAYSTPRVRGLRLSGRDAARAPYCWSYSTTVRTQQRRSALMRKTRLIARFTFAYTETIDRRSARGGRMCRVDLMPRSCRECMMVSEQSHWIRRVLVPFSARPRPHSLEVKNFGTCRQIPQKVS